MVDGVRKGLLLLCQNKICQTDGQLQWHFNFALRPFLSSKALISWHPKHKAWSFITWYECHLQLCVGVSTSLHFVWGKWSYIYKSICFIQKRSQIWERDVWWIRRCVRLIHGFQLALEILRICSQWGELESHSHPQWIHGRQTEVANNKTGPTTASAWNENYGQWPALCPKAA